MKLVSSLYSNTLLVEDMCRFSLRFSPSGAIGDPSLIYIGVPLLMDFDADFV